MVRAEILKKTEKEVEIEERIDESGNLYVRIDKQKAYNKKVVLNKADSIRFKFQIRIPHGKKAKEHVRYVLNQFIDETGGYEN